MPELFLDEVAFRLYDLSTFERYYRIVEQIVVHKVRWRQWEVYLLLALMLYHLQLHLFFYFRSISPWCQVALFDFVSLLRMVFYFDILICLFILISIYMINMIVLQPKVMFSERWVEQIVSLESKTQDKTKLKLYRSTQLVNLWRSHVSGYLQYQTSLATIHQYCVAVLQLARLSQFVIYAFFILTQIQLVQRIVVLQWYEPLLYWQLLLVVFSGEMHLWSYYVVFSTSWYMCLLCLGLFMMVSLVIFHSFHRAHLWLICMRRSSRSHLLVNYYRFTIKHTMLVLETFRVNHFMSTLYFLFVIISLPINALMLMTLLLGRFAFNFVVFALLIIAVTTALQAFFHLMMVTYNHRIHWHCKPLLRVAASRCTDIATVLRDHLHMHHQVVKFHTRNQYGITNGPLGVVTNQAMAKKAFYYLRMFIFSYYLVCQV